MVRPQPRPGASGKDDAGFSLAELLVVLALVALVIPLGGAVLRSAVETQDSVQTMTNGSTAAQAVVASLESGVRNAADLRHAPGDAPGDELLVVWTRNTGASDTGWTCQAWLYRAAKQTIYTRRVPAPPSAGWTLPRDDNALESSWTTLTRRVKGADGSTAVFAPHPAGTGVDVAFSIVDTRPASTEVAPDITVRTSIVRRPQQPTGVTPC